MDKTLQELENELKRLSPGRPSAGLMAALERELGPAAVSVSASLSLPTKCQSQRAWIAWSLATAAAVLLAAIVQFGRRPPGQDQSSPNQLAASPSPKADSGGLGNRFEPIQATSVLYDLREDGTAILPDQSEGRQVRYRYVDTYTWKNPKSNASLRWSVPRDEVRVIRASLD
ncbi:MAG TPA: hypothetical protein VHN79_04625 [Lacunisphaera sp.]|nr:hypothetical protein [Lacunisphaera sp.]